MGATFFVAVVPSCVHIGLLAYDLTQKAIVRPAAKFLAGLLEFLSSEKRPIAWVVGLLGALPAILKAWAAVVP